MIIYFEILIQNGRILRELGEFYCYNISILSSLLSVRRGDMDGEEFYYARKRRDKKYEGKFYIGVWSRGVFCRVTCPAPLPESKDDMIYFHNIYEALNTGLQPCLDCEPDMHSEHIILNRKVSNIVNNAVDLISEGYLNAKSVVQLADKLYISERYLRKIFMVEVGLSPTQLANYHKSIFAKKLLYETDMSITNIAFTSGFGSVRQFNYTFKKIFKKAPSEFRHNKKTSEDYDNNILYLTYTDSFDYENALNEIKRQLIVGVELVKENYYYRTFCINNIIGHFMVENLQEEKKLKVSIFTKDRRCYMAIYNKLKRMFGLNENAKQQVIGFNPFEVTLKTILKDGVDLKEASEIEEKLIKKCKKVYDCDVEGISFIYPNEKEIDRLDLLAIGVKDKCAELIKNVNTALINNEVTLAYNQTYEKFMEDFKAIKGMKEEIINEIAEKGLGISNDDR